MGVPMISLLNDMQNDADSRLDLESADVDTSDVNNIEMRSIATNKLASRVGASLLHAVGLQELVYPNMDRYEDAMVRCALDTEWFDSICQQLNSNKDSSALFDTKRWVENLEAAFRTMLELGIDDGHHPDIVVTDDL